MRATPRTPASSATWWAAARRLGSQIVGHGRRQLTGGPGHALASHVLVPVVEDLGRVGDADGSLDGGQLQLGPAAHGQLEVPEVRAERLHHSAVVEVLVRPQAGLGGGVVLHHLDADGRPPETGLEDVGTAEGSGACRGEQRPGQRRQAGCTHHRPEGQLVHAQSGSGHRGPGVGDAGQVERGLEGAVLAGAAVAADDGHVEWARGGAGPTGPRRP